MNEVKKNVGGSAMNQFKCVLLANIPIFVYGVQIGWMSPMALILQSEDSPAPSPLSDSTISWMASALCFSAILGVPLFGITADKLGRKPAIILLSIPQAISWFLKIYSAEPHALIIARVLAGVSAGGAFSIVPMFIKEISEDALRGALTSTVVLSCHAGIVLVFILGGLLSYNTILWVFAPLPIIHLALSISQCPETPPFLVKRGRNEEAAKSLSWLRGLPVDSTMIVEEVDSLKYENEQFPTERISISSIVRSRSTMKAFTICIVLMTIQTMSGCFAVVTYASDIFSKAGGSLSTNVIAVGIGLIQLVGSFVATFTLEKFGRKFLMSSSSLVMGLCMAVLGTWFYLMDNSNMALPSWIPLSAVGLSIFCNATEVAPIPFVIVSEIFSFQIRATMASAVLMYTWTNNSIVLYAFKPVASSFGSHTAFLFFATVCLIGGIYTIICVPETKGKSVEQIHAELMGNKKWFRVSEKEILKSKDTAAT